MARARKRKARPEEAAAADDPAARLERLMAAPVLQPWTPRWQEPIFRTPPKPGILGDRWRSVFAGVRPPAPRHIHSSFPPPSFLRPRTLSPEQALFTRPEWRPPVTELPMRRPDTELPPPPRGGDSRNVPHPPSARRPGAPRPVDDSG